MLYPCHLLLETPMKHKFSLHCKEVFQLCRFLLDPSTWLNVLVALFHGALMMGMYMMGVDHVLRLDGYWVLAGPPINWKNNYQTCSVPKMNCRRNIERLKKSPNFFAEKRSMT